jgi:apolipoprotein N-acyltransferase
MTPKNLKPNLRPKISSASFLMWVVSVFYLLTMIWLLLATTGTYGTHEPWLGSAAAGVTVAYGILMLLLWRIEERRFNHLSS